MKTKRETRMMAKANGKLPLFKNKTFKKNAAPQDKEGIKEEALQLLAEINDMEAVARMLNITVHDIESWQRAGRSKRKKQADPVVIAEIFRTGVSLFQIKKRTGVEMGVIKNVLRKEFGYKSFYELHGVIKYFDVAEQAKFDAERRGNIVMMFKEGWLIDDLSKEFGLSIRVIEKILYKEGCVNDIKEYTVNYKRKSANKRNAVLYADFKNGMSEEDVAVKYELNINKVKYIINKHKLIVEGDTAGRVEAEG